jgi:coiled-coil domain-containing protein 130
VRKRLRVEKKAEQVRTEADKSLKERYGLPAELTLERADDASAAAEAREEWVRARAERAGEGANKKRRLAMEAPVLAAPLQGTSAPSESTASTAASSLRARILSNTARRTAAGSGGASVLSPPVPRKGTSGRVAGIALRKA